MEIRIHIADDANCYDEDIYVAYEADAIPRIGDGFFLRDKDFQYFEKSIVNKTTDFCYYRRYIYGTREWSEPYFTLEDCMYVTGVWWKLTESGKIECHVSVGEKGETIPEERLIPLEECEKTRLEILKNLES